MRTRIPLLLTAIVVLFYAGVAGIGVAPYYSALTGFVHSATGRPTNGTATPLARASATRGPSAPPSATALPRGAAGQAKKPVKRLTTAQAARTVQHLLPSVHPAHGRVNILVLGSDNDAKFASYANPLTQVMIVLSFNTISHTVTMLSIPRDFWVHIPGYGYNYAPDGSGTIGWSKIDVASELGFNSAACTVEWNFDIPIDHWVWVGLKGFTKVVDSLNGVTLDVSNPLIDDTYPADLVDPKNPFGFQRLYIPPGPQHLDGNTALHFVRSRHGDISGDFGRSQRQQILLTELRHMLEGQDSAGLVALAPTLLHDLQGELKTDLPVDLATATSYWSLLRSMDRTKVHQVILSPPDYSTENVTQYDNDPNVTGGGPALAETTVAPNWTAINPEIQRLFGGQSSTHPHCTASMGSTGGNTAVTGSGQ